VIGGEVVGVGEIEGVGLVGRQRIEEAEFGGFHAGFVVEVGDGGVVGVGHGFDGAVGVVGGVGSGAVVAGCIAPEVVIGESAGVVVDELFVAPDGGLVGCGRGADDFDKASGGVVAVLGGVVGVVGIVVEEADFAEGVVFIAAVVGAVAVGGDGREGFDSVECVVGGCGYVVFGAGFRDGQAAGIVLDAGGRVAGALNGSGPAEGGDEALGLRGCGAVENKKKAVP